MTIKTRTANSLLIPLFAAAMVFGSTSARAHLLFRAAADKPAEGWRTNMWGKREDGTTGTAKITTTTGPEGGGALQVTVKDSPGCSAISPDFEDGAWRHKKYKAVEVTYRGDGSPNHISFYLSGKAADGKTSARARFSLGLREKGWKTVVLHPAKPKGGKPSLELCNAKNMYFGCRGTVSFTIAWVRLLTADDL